MVERAKAGEPGGSLIGTASTGAITGLAVHQTYSASKAALVMILKGIAVEYGRYGIRANAVLPGWTATDMTVMAQGNADFEKNVLSRAALKRWGRIDEFRGIAVYLASEASSFHTGDAIVIDGGFTTG